MYRWYYRSCRDKFPDLYLGLCQVNELHKWNSADDLHKTNSECRWHHHRWHRSTYMRRSGLWWPERVWWFYSCCKPVVHQSSGSSCDGHHGWCIPARLLPNQCFHFAHIGFVWREAMESGVHRWKQIVGLLGIHLERTFDTVIQETKLGAPHSLLSLSAMTDWSCRNHQHCSCPIHVPVVGDIFIIGVSIRLRSPDAAPVSP